MFDSWKIRKGCHYSNFIPWFKLFKENTLEISYLIKFDESCKYVIEEKSCVNKLFGVSLGLFGVHKDSIRYGWVNDGNSEKIKLYRYIYNEGKLFKWRIAGVQVNEEVECRIILKKVKDGKQIEVNYYLGDVLKDVFMMSNPGKKICMGLGFYFGGNSKAPHTMKCYKSKRVLI